MLHRSGNSGSRHRSVGARTRHRDGFTLVELMIATFLITVGILATSQVFVVADRHVSYSQQETTATALAQEIQEKIMSETFSDIATIFDGIDTNDPDSVPLPASDWATHVTERLPAGGRGVVEVVTPAQDETLPYGSVAVTITISWYEGTTEVEMPLRFSVAKIGS
ncbi:MAG: prepilin-type N-terminal cleavage/methylation domain-containing protein [Candidatus Eisenbacteria bacterium]|nr:prepilin-type N-terminal cleavage/methylation domain-containing protein [Candidatus Eisenbacteria bacterium]